MLLQIIRRNGGVVSFFPIAVHPSNVVSASYVEPSTVFLSSDSYEPVTAITFARKVLIGVDANNEKVYIEDALVTGHFQRISVALELDTDGSIAEEFQQRFD